MKRSSTLSQAVPHQSLTSWHDSQAPDIKHVGAASPNSTQEGVTTSTTPNTTTIPLAALAAGTLMAQVPFGGSTPRSNTSAPSIGAATSSIGVSNHGSSACLSETSSGAGTPLINDSSSFTIPTNGQRQQLEKRLIHAAAAARMAELAAQSGQNSARSQLSSHSLHDDDEAGPSHTNNTASLRPSSLTDQGCYSDAESTLSPTASASTPGILTPPKHGAFPVSRLSTEGASTTTATTTSSLSDGQTGHQYNHHTTNNNTNNSKSKSNYQQRGGNYTNHITNNRVNNSGRGYHPSTTMSGTAASYYGGRGGRGYPGSTSGRGGGQQQHHYQVIHGSHFPSGTTNGAVPMYGGAMYHHHHHHHPGMEGSPGGIVPAGQLYVHYPNGATYAVLQPIPSTTAGGGLGVGVNVSIAPDGTHHYPQVPPHTTMAMAPVMVPAGGGSGDARLQQSYHMQYNEMLAYMHHGFGLQPAYDTYVPPTSATITGAPPPNSVVVVVAPPGGRGGNGGHLNRSNGAAGTGNNNNNNTNNSRRHRLSNTDDGTARIAGNSASTNDVTSTSIPAAGSGSLDYHHHRHHNHRGTSGAHGSTLEPPPLVVSPLLEEYKAWLEANEPPSPLESEEQGQAPSVSASGAAGPCPEQWQVTKLQGHLYAFCRDQFGSRLVQQGLMQASRDEARAVFEELKEYLGILVVDVFGNYVIQKLLEVGDQSLRSDIAASMKTKILQLSLQTYGCRVVQKLLEVVTQGERIQVCIELTDHTLRCVQDQNGNHVIQKCIEYVQPSDSIRSIVEIISFNVLQLSSHAFGCRLVQRLLEYCTLPDVQSRTIGEILRSIALLAHDQYGNYVIQHLVEKGPHHARTEIFATVIPHAGSMSQHKFASNVVEACLKYGSSEERRDVLQSLLQSGNSSTSTSTNIALHALARHKFGNYVVQRGLEVAEEPERGLVLQALRPHVDAVRKHPHGRHCALRVETMLKADGVCLTPLDSSRSSSSGDSTPQSVETSP